MRATFADAAIGDHLIFAVYALGAVQLLQLLRGLERAVVVGGLGPGHIGSSRNMAGALRSFAHTWGRNDLSGEFVDRSYVHQVAAFAILDDRKYIFLASAYRFIRTAGVIGCRSDFWRLDGQW